MGSHKKKLIFLSVLVLLDLLLTVLLAFSDTAVGVYSHYVFAPFQHLRNLICSVIDISIGDVFYVTGSMILLFLVVRLVYMLLRINYYKAKIGSSFLSFLVILAGAYLWFFIGWGGNYYQQPLSDNWRLEKNRWNNETALPAFDSFLVTQLNKYVKGYRGTSLAQTNDQAWSNYEMYVQRDKQFQGVYVKPTLFEPLMLRMEVQGYYNPFTGEGQVQKSLPAFMRPFVVCHEMAHQCGIAAEDDANLLAYALCTETTDSSFRYSGYFNVWLYVHGRLRMTDSVKANGLKKQLNNTSLAHLDTLKAIRMRYEGRLSNYSSAFYDGYLKMNHQKEGLRSYNKVLVTAWALEEKRKNAIVPLVIP